MGGIDTKDFRFLELDCGKIVNWRGLSTTVTKKLQCVSRESNPGQLLGRQLCSPLYHWRFCMKCWYKILTNLKHKQEQWQQSKWTAEDACWKGQKAVPITWIDVQAQKSQHIIIISIYRHVGSTSLKNSYVFLHFNISFRSCTNNTKHEFLRTAGLLCSFSEIDSKLNIKKIFYIWNIFSVHRYCSPRTIATINTHHEN